MYFQVWLGLDKQWHWHLRAANHEIIAQGEAYTSKQNALHVISLIKSAPVHDAEIKK